MSAFLTPLRFEDDGGLPFTLTEPLRYQSDVLGDEVCVPVGFRTDLASIPRGLWNVLPKVGKWDKAAVVHDALYFYGRIPIQGRAVTKAEADAVLREAMTLDGVGWWARFVIYSGVRLGGFVAWNHYREGA